MKNFFKKSIAGLCVAAILCGTSVIDAHALTRRLYGDVNGDDIISIDDATLIQKYLVGLEELDKYQLIAADVDKDGKVTIKDATLIQKLLAGIITEFETGECFYY